MLIRYFRKISPLSPVLLFLLSAVLWAEIFLEPEPVFFVASENPSPLYLLLQPVFISYPIGSWVAAMLFVYLQALMISVIVTRQGMLDKYSFLASLMYVVLMGSLRGMLFMHPVVFSNFFLLLALKIILEKFDEEEVMKNIFNASMLIALAGLFYMQAWLFFLFLIISLFVFYAISLRSFVAACLGFVTPFFFYFFILFMTDSLDNPFLDTDFSFSWFAFSAGSISGPLKALVAYGAVLCLMALFHLVAIYLPDKPIRLRKRLWTLVYYSFLAIITFLFVTDYKAFHAALLFIPMSVVLAGFFHQIQRKAVSEVLFAILLGLILAGKAVVLV